MLLPFWKLIVMKYIFDWARAMLLRGLALLFPKFCSQILLPLFQTQKFQFTLMRLNIKMNCTRAPGVSFKYSEKTKGELYSCSLYASEERHFPKELPHMERNHSTIKTIRIFQAFKNSWKRRKQIQKEKKFRPKRVRFSHQAIDGWFIGGVPWSLWYQYLSTIERNGHILFEWIF